MYGWLRKKRLGWTTERFVFSLSPSYTGPAEVLCVSKPGAILSYCFFHDCLVLLLIDNPHSPRGSNAHSATHFSGHSEEGEAREMSRSAVAVESREGEVEGEEDEKINKAVAWSEEGTSIRANYLRVCSYSEG